jgi:hypothetical protein
MAFSTMSSMWRERSSNPASQWSFTAPAPFVPLDDEGPFLLPLRWSSPEGNEWNFFRCEIGRWFHRASWLGKDE